MSGGQGKSFINLGSKLRESIAQQDYGDKYVEFVVQPTDYLDPIPNQKQLQWAIQGVQGLPFLSSQCIREAGNNQINVCTAYVYLSNFLKTTNF